MENIAKVFSCFGKPPRKDSSSSFNDSTAPLKQAKASIAHPMTKMGPPDDTTKFDDTQKSQTGKTQKSCAQCGKDFEDSNTP